MERTVVLTECRTLKKVAVADAADATTLYGSASVPSAGTTGVFALTDNPDNPTLSAQTGVSNGLFLLPGRTTSGTYALQVYGIRLVGTVWHKVYLFSATVAATRDPGGDNAADSFAASECGASSITVDAGVPAASYTVYDPASNGGRAAVVVSTQGCPFFLFRSTDTTARVMACGAT